MKITIKQEQEIDFFTNRWGESFTPTQKEKDDYILGTVHGEVELGQRSDNRIFQKKRRFEMTYKLWEHDLRDGLLLKQELMEDFGDHPFSKKIINNLYKKILSSVSKEDIVIHWIRKS